MINHPVATREEWLRQRIALLAREKAHTRAGDALAKSRRELPWVKIETDYRFDGETGEIGLADLFNGKNQLAIYHFMFGKDWEAGCPSCSFWGDTFNGLDIHLKQRDCALVLASSAPLDRLLAFRTRMRWTMPWVSSGKSSFNQDFGVTFTQEQLDSPDAIYNYTGATHPGVEAPGLSTFVKTDDGAVYHNYSAYGRGLDSMLAAYQLLDFTAFGRNEDDFPYPMAWIRRQDEYALD